MTSDSSLQRYSSKEFPPYSYVPGSGTPHPVSDPQGHMYGLAEPRVSPLNPDRWQENETFLYAIDLFNHGYFWEAHEAWEALWHAVGRTGTEAKFLKGLIKIAAAGVKQLEDNASGVRRHSRRAIDILSSLPLPVYCGVNLEVLLKGTGRLVENPTAKIAPIVLSSLSP